MKRHLSHNAFRRNTACYYQCSIRGLRPVRLSYGSHSEVADLSLTQGVLDLFEPLTTTLGRRSVRR